jgi:hypothetical protein
LNLLGELLVWLYCQSEPVLGRLPPSQLVQLLWGLARLKQALPKDKPGEVLV